MRYSYVDDKGVEIEVDLPDDPMSEQKYHIWIEETTNKEIPGVGLEVPEAFMVQLALQVLSRAKRWGGPDSE